MTAHVLCDSGTTQSFVSLPLNKKFSDASGILEYPLEVKIVDDRSVTASSVHHGCVLNVYNKKYSIDLLPTGITGYHQDGVAGSQRGHD